jgi:hypothetical protein
VEREALLDGGVRVEDLPEQRHGDRGLGADQALDHPRHAAAGVQPELEETRVEPGGGPDDADVAGEREVEPGSDRRSVDGADRRQGGVRDGEEPGVDRAQALLAGFAEGCEVRAGAEGGRRAGDDDGGDVLVLFAGRDVFDQLSGHRHGEGVAALGEVDGDDADPVAPLQQYGHGRQL